jgi:hypothetical protein
LVLLFLSLVASSDPLVANSTSFLVTFNDGPSFNIRSAEDSPVFLDFELLSLADEDVSGDVGTVFTFSKEEWGFDHTTSFSPNNVTTENVTFWSAGPGPSRQNSELPLNGTMSEEFNLSFSFLLLTYNGSLNYLPPSPETFNQRLFPQKPLLRARMAVRGWSWSENSTKIVLSTAVKLSAILFTTQNTSKSLEVILLSPCFFFVPTLAIPSSSFIFIQLTHRRSMRFTFWRTTWFCGFHITPRATTPSTPSVRNSTLPALCVYSPFFLP